MGVFEEIGINGGIGSRNIFRIVNYLLILRLKPSVHAYFLSSPEYYSSA